jgi:hypothetical protein
MNPYVTNPHPSQFEMPQQYIAAPPQSVYSSKQIKELSVGEKINKAFYITLLYLLFFRSFGVLDNIHFMFTQKSYEYLSEETGKPTTKGYIVTSVLFFGLVLWLLYR